MYARVFLIASAGLMIAGCATNSARTDTPALPFGGWAQACEKWDDWDKPGPAFRVHGNTYYVGTCGISAILVTGGDGHVLIDSGTSVGAQTVLANVEALDFDPEDIGLLLSSHEHFDHVGGLAAIQQSTRARYFSSPEASAAMASGKTAGGDPQFGAIDDFEPVIVAGFVANGTPVSYGSISITPIETPGHTPGAMSWSWQSCEEGDCKTIVYADSLSPVSAEGFRFSADQDYVAAYRAGLKRLADTECDILLTPHPTASWQHQRMASETGLVDGESCRRYAESIEQRLNKRLAEEAAR